MNASQLKLACEMASDASVDLTGVDTTPLDNHETLRTTVTVPTAVVAAILRRDNPNLATFAKTGKHYIRINDFRPAPRTTPNAVQITRIPAKRGRKPATTESATTDNAGETAATSAVDDLLAVAGDVVTESPVVESPVVENAGDDKPLSKRELRRRARAAKSAE